jgi:hypothetical protein
MARKAATKAKPLGTLVDELWAEREQKRKVEETLKNIEERIAAATLELMERMESDGLSQVRGTAASISIGASVSGNVTDWDAFGQFIIENQYLHLLQRRISDPAFRELQEAGRTVPGVEAFVRKRLNIRSL